MPEIEADRAVLLTESYRKTEGEPMVMRRAKAFRNIMEHLPITIRPEELVVGAATVSPRSCQIYPEFSFSWLEDEFDYSYDFLEYDDGEGNYKTEAEKRGYIVVDYIKEWLCANIKAGTRSGTRHLFEIADKFCM
jgi:pyruvate-formate lyase